jgi:phage-related protein (TIGR01555 family)
MKTNSYKIKKEVLDLKQKNQELFAVVEKFASKNQMTVDGLMNLVSNLGTREDKNAHVQYRTKYFDNDQFISIYRNSWIGAKIIDIPSFECTREWRNFTMQNEDEVKALAKAENALHLKTQIRDALKYSAIFGGSAIILGANDGQDLSEPLIIENVGIGDLKYIQVVDRRYIFPLLTGNEYYPASPNFLKPEHYTTQISPTMSQQYRIHRSRILKFDGIGIPIFEYIANNFWGDSIYMRVFEAISSVETVQKSITSMTEQANVDIWSIKDLQSTLRMNDGAEVLAKRIQTNDLLKSINNSVALDKDNETLERKPISFSGLDAIFEKFFTVIASASGIPATRLLGKSPDGMNASGASDIRHFYDHISSIQEDDVRPKLQYLDKILCMSTLGYIPTDLDFEFNPLWQMSDKELAELQNLKANRDSIYLREGVITPETVAKQLMLDETYQTLDEEDIKELEDLDAERMLQEELEKQLLDDEEKEDNAEADKTE